MDADVIQFAAHRQAAPKAKPIQAEPIHLPKIYRLTGFGEMVDAPPFYALLPDWKMENEHQRWIQLDKLDPQIDSGWVIVRHHKNQSELKGYINSQMDLVNDTFSQVLAVGEDAHGIYSIIAREPVEDTPDCLLIYVISVDEMVEIEDVLTQPDIYFIYHPDGTVTYDPSIILPFMAKQEEK